MVVAAAPDEDLSVLRAGEGMVLTPRGNLDDSGGGGGEEGVKAGPLDAGGFLSVDGVGAEAGLAVAADVDVEFCRWGGC